MTTRDNMGDYPFLTPYAFKGDCHADARNDAYGVYATKDATFTAFTFFTFIVSLRGTFASAACGR